MCDVSKFKITLKDRPLTRRGILLTFSSVYDPIGILAPVVLIVKKILQNLCRNRIGWDNTLPDSIVREWISWIQDQDYALPTTRTVSRHTVYAHCRWRQVQYMSDLFWKRWIKEYLPQLQEPQKWSRLRSNFKLGGLVRSLHNQNIGFISTEWWFWNTFVFWDTYNNYI